MKRTELERKLRDLGWFPEREGGKHTMWGHAVKTHKLWVPRHPVIRYGTAKSILKDAER